ncbi:MAG: putative transporter [Oligoflexia bacterium]|nr:putative transporter [Oligoflexia bacterium]
MYLRCIDEKGNLFMTWPLSLIQDSSSIPHAVLAISLAISIGLAIGHIRILGVSLGVGGVLFSGLLLGHFKMSIEKEVFEFIREFGLILFVYAIGLQVGPGFFSSFRRQGLTLNLLATAIVLGGTCIAVIIALTANLDISTIIGILSGAVTNTPGLGAAQQALKDFYSNTTNNLELVGLAYAVSYPFGIVGIILTMIIIKKLFKIDIAKEAESFSLLENKRKDQLLTKDFEITNPNLQGKTVKELIDIIGSGVVITRVYNDGQQELAKGEAKLRLGSVIHAIGSAKRLEDLRIIVGLESKIDLPSLPSPINVTTVLVTKKEVVGKHLTELDLINKYGVIITRIARSGIEFTPTKNLTLQFADRLKIVGDSESIQIATEELGNSAEELDRPQIIPIFVGIALGVIVGTMPIAIPTMPAPVKLGLAGGPLIVALILGSLGKVGPILSYMPTPAKMLLREFGIALFLACVGLKSGEHLFKILSNGDGFKWMLYGSLITFIPLFVVAIGARLFKKMNYLTLCGLLSGSMTDPPALAFATQITKHDAPSISYATVYPLTMLLRVVIAQILVIMAIRW